MQQTVSYKMTIKSWSFPCFFTLIFSCSRSPLSHTDFLINELVDNFSKQFLVQVWFLQHPSIQVDTSFLSHIDKSYFYRLKNCSEKCTAPMLHRTFWRLWLSMIYWGASDFKSGFLEILNFDTHKLQLIRVI